MCGCAPWCPARSPLPARPAPSRPPPIAVSAAVPADERGKAPTAPAAKAERRSAAPTGIAALRATATVDERTTTPVMTTGQATAPPSSGADGAAEGAMAGRAAKLVLSPDTVMPPTTSGVAAAAGAAEADAAATEAAAVGRLCIPTTPSAGAATLPCVGHEHPPDAHALLPAAAPVGAGPVDGTGVARVSAAEEVVPAGVPAAATPAAACGPVSVDTGVQSGTGLPVGVALATTHLGVARLPVAVAPGTPPPSPLAVTRVDDTAVGPVAPPAATTNTLTAAVAPLARLATLSQESDAIAALPEGTQQSQSTQLFNDDDAGASQAPLAESFVAAGRARARKRGKAPAASPGSQVTDGVGDDVSYGTAPVKVGGGVNPRDGVYTLSEPMRAKIATLLRALFVVQTTSDKSIMPFLGIAHYLMTFSYIIGVTSTSSRTDFFDALSVAFESPVSMKYFMEEAFRCGPQRLHVGGRISPQRHVTGQPKGFRDDILRQRINKDNVKVQWLSRRLSLRTITDIQRGARSSAGGLSVQDRNVISASVSNDGTCVKLRERGCVVKFAQEQDGPKKPLCLTFQWDESSTWLPEGLEAGLVGDLQYLLLKATPAAHVDRMLDPPTKPPARASVRKGVVKRAETGKVLVGGARPTKRSRQDRPPVPQDVDVLCSKCGVAPGEGTETPRQVVVPTLEHWSADVAQSPDVPRGGHVLAFTLPIHMDAGQGGRPFVDFDMRKTSTAGGPPYKYHLFFKRSDRPPEATGGVDGAAFAGEQDAMTSVQSHDILRSVRSHVSQRRVSPSSSNQNAPPPEEEAPSSAQLRLHVRSAPRTVPLTERFDIVSEFELSSRAELVSRTPGRMVIFLEGIDPLPVRGAFTL